MSEVVKLHELSVMMDTVLKLMQEASKFCVIENMDEPVNIKAAYWLTPLTAMNSTAVAEANAMIASGYELKMAAAVYDVLMGPTWLQSVIFYVPMNMLLEATDEGNPDASSMAEIKLQDQNWRTRGVISKLSLKDTEFGVRLSKALMQEILLHIPEMKA